MNKQPWEDWTRNAHKGSGSFKEEWDVILLDHTWEIQSHHHVTMSIHLQNHLIYSSIIEKFTSKNIVHNPAVHVEAIWYIDMIWWWEPHKTSGITGRKHKFISQHNRQSQSYTPPHSASMHRLDGIMGMVPRWVIFQTPRVRDTWRRMTESQPLSKLYSDRVWLVMN